MSIQAMKQALEALEAAHGNINPERGFCDEVERDINKAIPALRAAITEAERQEPAFKTNGSILIALSDNTCFDAEWIDLYTTPQPAIPEWQPIETAPKDGEEILICTGEGCRYVVSYDDIFSAPWRIRNDQGMNEHVPTHWMPLPAAPKPENSHD